jgi:hypothetical protein
MTIKYGGHLQPGDFIAIAESGFMNLGWYFGEGRNGSVQYYFFRAPNQVHADFQTYQNKQNVFHNASYIHKRYEGGFTLKSIWKSYVYGSNVGPTGSRVIKIENPESIFANQEDLEAYLQSKEILNNLKFPAK